jgi:hypothetical protein
MVRWIVRPSFDKIVITLSEYYHTLKKIQDVDTECPELSEESEEGAMFVLFLFVFVLFCFVFPT